MDILQGYLSRFLAAVAELSESLCFNRRWIPGNSPPYFKQVCLLLNVYPWIEACQDLTPGSPRIFPWRWRRRNLRFWRMRGDATMWIWPRHTPLSRRARFASWPWRYVMHWLVCVFTGPSLSFSSFKESSDHTKWGDAGAVWHMILVPHIYQMHATRS